ncbi:MAG: NAD(P)H-dependent oxidoreductase [Clostridium paraputrificum]
MIIKSSNSGNDVTADGTTSASADASTSASIVPENLVQDYKPKGFTDSKKKKALFVIGDPRKDSVNYDLAVTAMKHFEEKNVEVEVRDLYDMKFNPVLSLENSIMLRMVKENQLQKLRKSKNMLQRQIT